MKNAKELRELVGEERVDADGAVIIKLLPEEWTRHILTQPKKRCATK